MKTRTRRARHVARMRERRGAYRVFEEKHDGKTHVEDLSVDGKQC
jgi:hypothetical protein